MFRRSSSRLSVLLVLSLLVVGGRASADEPGRTVAGPDAETARILHLLRRTTFGPRPADVEEVRRLGREAWIERQLHPEQIVDRELEDRLTKFETLDLTPTGYWAMLEAGRPAMEVVGPGESRQEAARRRQREINRLRNLSRQEVPAAVLLRAVYSRRQLQEVLCDFWRNHFNVWLQKGDVPYYLPDWEREVLRPHVLGSFEDFLLATARHPAMLFYLDNHVSQAPRARGERVLQGREREDRTDGLNENYARELMELHTVGVDNGYDQDDVIQLALVLTGWSIDGSSEGRGRFLFQDRYHAKGRKRVMGKVVRDGGIEEGETVIRHLADHRNTREFVSRKLVTYLVADDPPEAIVDAAVAAWKASDGDLREVTRAILLHEDFDAPAHRATKAKTPLEFVASTLRVTGAEIEDSRAVLDRLQDMSMGIYDCEDPTGYSDEARDWMDPGVLLVRWQLAYDLLHGRLRGVTVPERPLLLHARQRPEAWEDALVADIFAGAIPGSVTMTPFRRRIRRLEETGGSLRPAEREGHLRVLATLLLGSPEFQRQ